MAWSLLDHFSKSPSGVGFCPLPNVAVQCIYNAFDFELGWRFIGFHRLLTNGNTHFLCQHPPIEVQGLDRISRLLNNKRSGYTLECLAA